MLESRAWTSTRDNSLKQKKKLERVSMRRNQFGAHISKRMSFSILVEFWGLVAIVERNKPIKVRVVLHRIGNGNVVFWSAMPYGKLANGGQKLFGPGIEDE